MKKTLLALMLAAALSGCRGNADELLGNSRVAADLVRTIAQWFGASAHDKVAPKASNIAFRLPEYAPDLPHATYQTYVSDIQYTPSKKQIYYFDADGKAVNAAVNDGFYSEVLGKTADGRLVAQDFYQSSKTPQTAPFILMANANPHDFSPDKLDSRSVWFDRAGNVQALADYRAGKIMSETVVFQQGKIVCLVNDAQERMIFFNQDAIEAAMRLVDGEQKKEIVIFYPNGSAMVQIIAPVNDSSENAMAYAWDEHGKAIDFDDVRERVTSISRRIDGTINYVRSF